MPMRTIDLLIKHALNEVPCAERRRGCDAKATQEPVFWWQASRDPLAGQDGQKKKSPRGPTRGKGANPGSARTDRTVG